jgi:hypothetical protein
MNEAADAMLGSGVGYALIGFFALELDFTL